MLPVYVAQAARFNNDEPIIVSIVDDVHADWKEFTIYHVSIGNFRYISKLIKEHSINRIVISGSISCRPKLRQLRWEWRSLFFLPKFMSQLISAGDAAILKIVIEMIEDNGVKVIGAHEVVPNLLAKTGPLGVHVPGRKDKRDILSAMRAADALGSLDIGQGVISVGGRVVALEGAEGTDAMLERIGPLKSSGRIYSCGRGVLVKMCKSQQDIRADLPAIGLLTIKNAIKAGLAGIVLESGKSLVLEQDDLIRVANEAGLFIYGIDRGLEKSALW